MKSAVKDIEKDVLASDGALPWVACTLGEVLELKYGKSLAAAVRDGEGFPVYGSNGIVGLHSRPLVEPAGIIVGRKGSFGEVQISEKPFFPIDTTYFVDDLLGQPMKYWFYQLKNLPLTQLNRSTAIPGLNREDAYALTVRLPPLAEQKAIAEKLDTLLAQVETTKARVERIPDILKRFRQSVLASAVSGRLTENWRLLHPELASRIYEMAETHKTRRALPDRVAPSEVLEKFHFPESWSVCSVASLLRKGVIVDLKDGNHGANHPKAAEFSPEGLPFITAAQMNEQGTIDYEGAPKLQGVPLKRLKVGFSIAGDVVYSHKGTVGRCGIADQDCVLSPQTTYVRLNHKYLLPSYCRYMLQSLQFVAQTDAVKSQTTRDFVPISAHYLLFYIVPPLEEQTEIVRRVDQLFAHADRIEKQAQAALERVNKLTQSILAKAFRGELTEQWRRDHPELISGENSAAALLERIRAERAASPKKGRRTARG